MITSATSKAEKKQIIQRLLALSERNLEPHEKEIKLAYVTVLSLYFSRTKLGLLNFLARKDKEG